MRVDSKPIRWSRIYWLVGGYTVVLTLLLYLIS